jgi:peptide-methionine (S)-S-oxide reductase
MKIAWRVMCLGLGLSLGASVGCRAGGFADGPVLPAPKVDDGLAAKPARETAVFAGGCFWGTQTVFEHVKGVVKVTAGYAGGKASTATYSQVTTETTKHAESVEVVFDPSRITYGTLLQVFFAIHDPTTLNRQGPDEGTSYRSAIFTTSSEGLPPRILRSWERRRCFSGRS